MTSRRSNVHVRSIGISREFDEVIRLSCHTRVEFVRPKFPLFPLICQSIAMVSATKLSHKALDGGKKASVAKRLLQNDHEKVTAFRRKVYVALCDVPEGRVTTYKLLAEHIGCKSSQAIGQALKNNPHAPVVPCHRVVATNLSIGGFSGSRAGPEIERKYKLLQTEGVKFTTSGTVDPSCVFAF
jgi:methylated-DNA-[protein]-cysteine S-methyltransferase